MSAPTFNKYRAALEILQHGRDVLVENLADEILDQGVDLTENGYLFYELLESQGTRLHFLSLLISLLEQSAEALDQTRAVPTPDFPPTQKEPTKRRTRSKKIQQQASTNGSADDV